MAHVNIEIKARCSDAERVRSALKERKADFRGVDRQTDTYFAVSRGRCKLRQGNIENSLIYYARPDECGPKRSDVWLYHSQPGTALKELLVEAMGVLATVKKRREIYFMDNVKFHIDAVEGLGDFVEIEAIDLTGQIGEKKLLDQCRKFMSLFGIVDEDLIECSYCDLLMVANR